MWPKTSSINGGVLLHWVTFIITGLPLLLQNQIAIASPLDQFERLAVLSAEPNNLFPVHALSKRIVPTTDEIVAAIDANGQVGTKLSIFWTSWYGYPGGQPYRTVVQWGTTKFGGRCNFNMYTDMMADVDYRRLNSMARGSAEDEMAINHFSKAFARRSKGIVYVVVPDGRQPGDDSVWAVWEAPTITRMPLTDSADKIVQVEYPSGRETTLWTKGGAPLYKVAPPGKV